MKTKIRIQEAQQLLRDVECQLCQEINDLDELFSDTEEWILYLTAAPSNLGTGKRFPMTPSDVSRSRKRVKVETIVESVEEDDVLPLPKCRRLSAEPACQPVHRGSRTAFKLANMKMKEPSLLCKLRRPAHDTPEANDPISMSSEAPPPKRARKGRSNAPQPDTSTATGTLSFTSARDSVLSTNCRKVQVEQEENETTKVLTRTKLTKKSSLQVQTGIETRSSKRIAEARITTVVGRPTKSNLERKASSRQHSVDIFSDSPGFNSADDNIPVINFVSKPSKNITTEPLPDTEQIVDIKSTAGNGRECKSLRVQLHHCDIKSLQKSDIIELKQININSAATHIDEAKCATPFAEEVLVIDASNAQVPAVTTLENSKPMVSSNATNWNTPETMRNFEPVSVKQRVKALENELVVKPVVPVQPEVPIRMTRTKVRAMMASLTSVTSLPEKQATKKIDTANLLKIARKSLVRAKKISIAKEHRNIELPQKSVQKENTSPRNAAKNCLPQSVRSTTGKNRVTPPSYVHPSRLLAQMSTSKALLTISPPRNATNCGLSQRIHSTSSKYRKTPHSNVHPSRVLAQMSISKQPLSLVNLNANLVTFLPKTKFVSAAEEAEEKRKEERRYRRENKDDALLKKKALIDDRTEQQKRKREEKERNVLAQKALQEREKEVLKLRIEKESEEKARLVQERDEKMRMEVIRKKEEAKLKAAKIEERRVKKEAERLQALKLQEEEQQKIQAQKKKEQEDAERLHAKRMIEEKERKEKEAAFKETALKLEKQKQAMPVAPSKPLNTTFEVARPVPLIAASKYDYPLPDLSKGNDSDFSEAEEEVVPSWASRDAILKNLKSLSRIPLKAILCYFGSKPTTPDLTEIFPNIRNARVRSSSAMWKTPPRSSMVPMTLPKNL